MKRLLLTLLFAAVPVVASAQITNNTCTTAGVIVPSSGATCENSINGTLSGSALLPNPTAICSYTAYKEVWFEFTATAPQHVVALSDLVPADPAGHLAIGVYSDCETLSFCGQNNIYASGLTPGELYKIRVIATDDSELSLNTGFTICVTSPESTIVTVSTNEYTTQELVNNVLLGNSCLQAANISSSTGIDYDSVNGIAYFEKGNSNFDLSEGIVLSSGDVNNITRAVSQIANSSGGPDWQGDSDLTAIMAPGQSKNASVIEFDFIPLTNEISIDYIFASNEYGWYQCNSRDGIAFMLTNMTAGTQPVNIAVIPNTATPVCVTTIRDNAYNPGCPSVNAQYFGDYYESDADNAPISFRGATKVMTAYGSVVPGHTYHLKLAVADSQDSVFDSAVFIPAGGLNIGTLEDVDIISSNGNALCPEETTTLSVNLEGNYDYSWTFNGVPVGNNSNSASFSGFGVYEVFITGENNECMMTQSIIISQGTGIPDMTIPDYYMLEENNDGFAAFDLNTKTAEISAMLNTPSAYTITYHATQEDAENNTNSLPVSYTNITNPQTVYARIQKAGNECFEVFNFNLIVEELAGVNDNTFASLKCYPNPSSSILTLENANGIDTVSIVNTLGQAVIKKTISNTTAQVDVSSLSKGVYFVTITSGSASKTIKIVKE